MNQELYKTYKKCLCSDCAKQPRVSIELNTDDLDLLNYGLLRALESNDCVVDNLIMDNSGKAHAKSLSNFIQEIIKDNDN